MGLKSVPVDAENIPTIIAAAIKAAGEVEAARIFGANGFTTGKRIGELAKEIVFEVLAEANN